MRNVVNYINIELFHNKITYAFLMKRDLITHMLQINILYLKYVTCKMKIITLLKLLQAEKPESYFARGDKNKKNCLTKTKI